VADSTASMIDVATIATLVHAGKMSLYRAGQYPRSVRGGAGPRQPDRDSPCNVFDLFAWQIL